MSETLPPAAVEVEVEVIPGIVVSGFGWETPDPCRVVPTFARQQYRIHCVIDGFGHLKTAEKDFHLSKGTGFIIFPGTIPNYHPDQEKPWEYFWVKLAGEEFDSLIDKAGLTRQEPGFHISGTMREMRELMYNICHAVLVSPASSQELSRCFHALFRKVVPFQAAGKNKPSYFDDCLKFIHDTYSENITIADIAEHAAIDRTYLYKLFKKNLGVSPQTYLINHRISQACDLIRSTDMSISSIAYAVGFRDFSDFSRQFRKRQKMAPTQFRILGSYANISNQPKP